MPGGTLLNAQPRPFTVERVKRRYPPRRVAGRSASTVPSSADAIRDIARQLGDIPREATESWPDMFHFLRREKGKLLVIADRIERNEPRNERPVPAPAKKGAPQVVLSARDAFYGRRKRPAMPREQLELLPC